MEPLLKLPDILGNDFAILMDHVEDEIGEMVLERMESILTQHKIPFLRKMFLAPGRMVCMLASTNWKYIEEY